jgi:DNA invertase Pin-like site-specific DNA recombinase
MQTKPNTETPTIQLLEEDRVDELRSSLLALIEDIEHRMVTKRVTDGIARAKAAGKPFGRPLLIFRRDKALELRRQGMSFRAIARALSVTAGAGPSEASIRRIVRAAKS